MQGPVTAFQVKVQRLEHGTWPEHALKGLRVHAQKAPSADMGSFSLYSVAVLQHRGRGCYDRRYERWHDGHYEHWYNAGTPAEMIADVTA